MKNFKKFAMMLVAVVLILIIGIFFKKTWQGIVANFVIWICGLFGLGHPGWCDKFVGAKTGDLGDDPTDDYVDIVQ